MTHTSIFSLGPLSQHRFTFLYILTLIKWVYVDEQCFECSYVGTHSFLRHQPNNGLNNFRGLPMAFIGIKKKLWV